MSVKVGASEGILYLAPAAPLTGGWLSAGMDGIMPVKMTFDAEGAFEMRASGHTLSPLPREVLDLSSRL